MTVMEEKAAASLAHDDATGIQIHGGTGRLRTGMSDFR
jgi:hypothetical protein